MYTFNQYFEKKEEIQRDVVEKKRKADIKKESDPAGWEEFEGNQKMVETYINWVTQE